MNIHLRNRFQTVTGLHNNRIRAQTVRNHLRENGLYARRPYIACVLTQRHRQNRLNWPRVHTRWIQRRWMNEYFLYNVLMAVRACTVGEMNAMLNVVFLNEIVSGVGILSWSGQPLPMVIVHH